MKRPWWTGLSPKALGSHTVYMRLYRARRRARDGADRMAAKDRAAGVAEDLRWVAQKTICAGQKDGVA